MFKELISALLVFVMIIGQLFGIESISYKSPNEPEISEKNLALEAQISDNAEDITKKYPLSSWKAERGDSFEINFGKEVSFNTVTLKEKGDNIRIFRFYKLVDGEWEMFYEQDRLAGYRMCTFEETVTTALKIEITECDGTVTLSGLGVYDRAKKDNKIRVSQYLTMGKDEIVDLRDTHDEGFSGYYDVVTDVIVFASVTVDENANLVFKDGEEAFAANVQALRDIVGERDVRFWLSVFFDRPAENGKSTLDATSDFVKAKCGDIVSNITAAVEKYNFDGVDYDWEYPQTLSQWKAYDLIITESAKHFKVSVALPPWGIKLSRAAVKSIEYVNVMTYDLFDARGDHSNIQKGTIESTKPLLAAGFDKKQILLGIPTYGRTVDRTGYSWPCFRGNEEILGKFNSIVPNNKFTDDNGVEQCYDAYVQSYAEARDKTAYAKAMDLGGIMIFRAKCDAPYTYEYSIHRAIKEAADN